MITTKTLEFEDARGLHELFANDLRLLKSLETSLGIKVTTRDGWVRLEGNGESVERASRVFDQLERARRSGATIEPHDFRSALRAAQADGEESLPETVSARIQCAPGRPPILARSPGQKRYIEAIRTHDVVFGIGPAGTGKTYLAMATAVEALKREQVRRIILTRPAVEAGEALGFLPGDLNEKIFPYLRPLYDALYDIISADEIENYLAKGVVEIAPLAYMRGRTLNHAFIILDEAQNTTPEQMLMFLTRLGADSRCVITGDHTQTDLPPHRQSGLIEALRVLREVPGIYFNLFGEADVVRHALVQSIIRAYQKHRGEPVRPGDLAGKE